MRRIAGRPWQSFRPRRAEGTGDGPRGLFAGPEPPTGDAGRDHCTDPTNGPSPPLHSTPPGPPTTGSGSQASRGLIDNLQASSKSAHDLSQTVTGIRDVYREHTAAAEQFREDLDTTALKWKDLQA